MQTDIFGPFKLWRATAGDRCNSPAHQAGQERGKPWPAHTKRCTNLMIETVPSINCFSLSLWTRLSQYGEERRAMAPAHMIAWGLQGESKNFQFPSLLHFSW